MIYNLWGRNGSTRNLVGLVGIHVESRRNLVGMILSPGEIWVSSHWHDIPTKFLPFLPFHPDSTWIPLKFLSFRSESARIHLDSYHSAWIRVECPGQGKVLKAGPNQLQPAQPPSQWLLLKCMSHWHPYFQWYLMIYLRQERLIGHAEMGVRDCGHFSIDIHELHQVL